MKKCPFCAEKIGSHSKICKYCGETLPIKNTPKLYIVKQHCSVINAAIFVILSRNIVSLLKSAYTGTFYISIVFGMIDLFFCYHLFKMKEWARKWIVGITIIKIVSLGRAYIVHNNYFEGTLNIVMLCCILVLLFGLGGKKKAIITSSAYSLLFIFLIGFDLIGISKMEETKNIIKNSPLIMEQSSDSGFKVILPSTKWKFLKKEDSIKLLGEFTKNANIVITGDSGNVVGFFTGEDLKNIDKSKIDRDLLINNFKKDLGKEYQVVNEFKADDGLGVEVKYRQSNTDYSWFYFYKILNNTGVIGNYFGDSAVYNKLRSEIKDTIEKIQEISKKEFLPKLTPQEIYKKYSDAIVLVRIYDSKGKIAGFSSGFNILENGLIVTNLHTILPGYYIDVKFPFHGVYENVYIVALSKKLHDLVILQIPGKNLPYVNLDDSMEIEIGDRVVAIGNPEGLVNSISEGIISGLRNIEGYSYYQLTAPISPGSSGGAVFNEFGNIIGVSSGTWEEGQNLNFCIPINEISDMEIMKQPITLSQFQDLLKKEGGKK